MENEIVVLPKQEIIENKSVVELADFFTQIENTFLEIDSRAKSGIETAQNAIAETEANANNYQEMITNLFKNLTDKVQDLIPKQAGFLTKLFSKTDPVKQSLNHYLEQRSELKNIGDELYQHKSTLLKSNAVLNSYIPLYTDFILTTEKQIEEVKKLSEQLKSYDISKLNTDKRNLVENFQEYLAQRIVDLQTKLTFTMSSVIQNYTIQETNKKINRQLERTKDTTMFLLFQAFEHAIQIKKSQEAQAMIDETTKMTAGLMKQTNQASKELAQTSIKASGSAVIDIKQVEQHVQSIIESSIQIREARKQAIQNLEKDSLKLEEIKTRMISYSNQVNEEDKKNFPPAIEQKQVSNIEESLNFNFNQKLEEVVVVAKEEKNKFQESKLQQKIELK